MALFMGKIDWTDPEFAKWKLCNLGELTVKQKEAFLDVDDSVDDPPVTVREQIDLCKKFECKVNLYQSNICKCLERDWSRKTFQKPNYKDLTPKEQRFIIYAMEKYGVKLYNERKLGERILDRCDRQKRRTFAPYWELRSLRHRYFRIKSVGEKEKRVTRRTTSSNSISFDSLGSNESMQTVIHTQKTKESDTQQSPRRSLRNLSRNSFSQVSVSTDGIRFGESFSQMVSQSSNIQHASSEELNLETPRFNLSQTRKVVNFAEIQQKRVVIRQLRSSFNESIDDPNSEDFSLIDKIPSSTQK